MGNRSLLTLYKASAGSGKTFMLAVRYITLLILKPQAYRNILAVTFTNKATAEMRQRILSQLYGISRSLESSAPYLEAVREQVPQTVSVADIRRNAGEALTLILQDYGHFRIETIDSFLQTVLKGLARELQLESSMSIELDVDSVISDAVDTFLSTIEPGSRESRNVLDFVQDNIDNDKGWTIDRQLKSFSRQLFSELFMEKSGLLSEIIDSGDAIGRYSKILREKLASTEDSLTKKLMECGERIRNALSARGYSVDTLLKNPGNLVSAITDGSYLSKERGATIDKCINTPESIFTKKILKEDPSLQEFTACVTAPLFQEASDIRNGYDYAGNSYNAALRHLNELALLLAIRREINRQNNEQGRFILADTANLLSSLTENDTSFVFEKTGSFVRNIMIDEFQDTSRMQWKNLGLIMHECLSQNCESLVVGDVKQSIYRWRNGDWNILNTGIEQKFAAYSPQTVTLRTNRRSKTNIIDFNNRLFQLAAQKSADIYSSMFGCEHEALAKAYSDVCQQATAKSKEGFVKVCLLREADKETDRTIAGMQMLEEEIDRLLDAGVSPGDITILLRARKDISAIAGYFAVNRPELEMVSGEAFQIDSSPAVRILVNAMRWIADDTDRVALASLIYELDREIAGDSGVIHRMAGTNLESLLAGQLSTNRISLKETPLYELAESLFQILELDRTERQDAYVMAFLDIVRDFAARKSADLNDFLNEWDSKLYNKSIPSVTTDSIRLMTIHASKGLEFHSVIVPDCDWKICTDGNQLWCEPSEEPFNGIPLVPVDYSAKLSNSTFSGDYRNETGKQIVDNLNLLYVALTRARCNLILLSATPKSKSATMASRISDIISECLDDFGVPVGGDGMQIFEEGTVLPHSDKSGSASDNPLEPISVTMEIPMKSYPLHATFRQSGDSRKFVRSSDEEGEFSNETYIEDGKLLHQLFASIRTEADIDREIRKLVSQGILESGRKAQSIAGMMHKAVSSEETSVWFDGHWTLFNEKSVLFRRNGTLQVRRPDRVMTDGKESIVLDFKFGKEKEEHLHQVREYMDLLGKMGFKGIKGYVWYVYRNKIINC